MGAPLPPVYALRTTEVWQAPAADSSRLFTLQEGREVRRLTAGRRGSDGLLYVPIAPRGWVKAEDLDAADSAADSTAAPGVKESSSQLKAAVSSLGGQQLGRRDPDERSDPAPVEAAAVAVPEWEDDWGEEEASWKDQWQASKWQEEPEEWPEEWPQEAQDWSQQPQDWSQEPQAEESEQWNKDPEEEVEEQALKLKEGGSFRASEDLEVRQAPALSSSLLYHVHAGNMVHVQGQATVLVDGLRRVPIRPRGWVNADLLEAVAGPPGLESQRGVNVPESRKDDGFEFESFEAVFDETPPRLKGEGKGKRRGTRGSKDQKAPAENGRSWQAESESSWKEDPWIDTDPWKQEDPLQKEDPWKKEQAEDWKQNGSYTEVNDKDKDHSHWQADPWIVNDPWDQGKEKKDSRQEDPWVDGHDPWKKGAQGWSNSRPQGKKGNAFMQSIQKVISQPTPNHNRAQRATKAAKADQAELEVDPIFENDPWSKEGKKSTEDEVGRPLQPWQPEKAPKDPEAKQKLFLEAALGPLDGPPEKWDQFKVNNELFGVTSTYDETLYTTKLDMSQVRPEVVQKAETVSREIAAAQVESISSEDEEAHFAAVPRAPPAPRAPRRFHDQGSGPQLQDQSKIDLLNALISQKKPNFETDADGNAAVQAVLVRVQAAVTAAKLDGAVKTFGSCATPLKSSGSDLDLAYTGTIKDPSPTGQVSYLASMVNPLKDLGFQDITKVFSSSTPLLKFFDPDGQLEVDFLIKNDLGIRNSHLLDTYCRCDPRVPVLGRLVKDWAKCHELVSVPDGCLNSYAYMLMVIHYLQSLQPPVVPNLQQDWPEWETDSHPVSDLKWGMENICETRFFDKVDELRRNPSANDTSDAELLIGFFNYYGWVFDWSENAVCIRLNGPGRFVDKFSLHPRVADAEQWHIEDPFDVRHNLAKHCTAAGRKRILRAMRHASSHLASAKLTDVCGPKAHRSWFLKCKVDASLSAEALLEKFSGYELLRLHFPVLGTRRNTAQAFLEFASQPARRSAQSLNDSYCANSQLCLLQSSKFALEEAMEDLTYHIHDCVWTMPEVQRVPATSWQ